MSHIVTIKTEIRDANAVRAACQRLGLPQPVAGTHALFSGQIAGLAVQLPKWLYPAVCELETGQLHYDNYRGRWGDQTAPRCLSSGLCRGKSQDRGPPQRAQRQRTGAGRRVDQADHPGGRCRVTKIIELIVSPTGETRLETKGFVGSGLPRGEQADRRSPRAAP